MDCLKNRGPLIDDNPNWNNSIFHSGNLPADVVIFNDLDLGCQPTQPAQNPIPSDGYWTRDSDNGYLYPTVLADGVFVGKTAPTYDEMFGVSGKIYTTAGLMFGDGDTLIYEPSDDQLHFRVGNLETLIILPNAIRSNVANSWYLNTVNSTSDPATPPYTFLNDTDTGMYRYMDNGLAFVTGTIPLLMLNGVTNSIILPVPPADETSNTKPVLVYDDDGTIKKRVFTELHTHTNIAVLNLLSAITGKLAYNSAIIFDSNLYYTITEIDVIVDDLEDQIDLKSDLTHNHNLANLAEKSYNSLDNLPDLSGLHSHTNKSTLDLIPDYTGANEGDIIERHAAGMQWISKVLAGETFKVSVNDTTPGYLEDKLTITHGTNTTNPLEFTTLNDAGNEVRQLQFDVSKVDHNSLLNFVANAHIDWTNAVNNFLTQGNIYLKNNSGTSFVSRYIYWGDTTDWDTYIYEVSDDSLRIGMGGADSFLFLPTSVTGSSTNAGALMNEDSTATNPTLIPNKTSANTGIGGVSGNLSLIISGVETLKISSLSVGINVTTPGANLDIANFATVGASIRLREATNNGTECIGFKAPDAIGTSVVYTFPTLGTTGYFLKLDDVNGTLVWAASGSGGMADPMTTAGDMIIRDTTNNTARLAISTAGKILTVTDVGGVLIPQWATAPAGLTIGGDDSPTGQIQYRASGNFAANDYFYFDSANYELYIIGAKVGAKNLYLQNTNGGTGSSSGIHLGNNVGTDSFQLKINSSAFTDAINFAYVWQKLNAPLLFGTNNTERVRIEADGVVKVITSLNVDTINEYISDAGITIDGILLKDEYVEFDEIAVPAAPASNKGRLYMSSADEKLYWKTSTTTYDLTSLGVIPVDSTLLDWSTDRYQPYAAAAAGALDSGVVNPSGTTRLNYGGYFYATKLYSGGVEVLTTIPADVVRTGQVNTYGDFAQTFKDNIIRINNPADTAYYTITAGAISTNRILNLPAITATDTIAVLGLAQTFTAINIFYSSGFKLNNPANTYAYTFVSSAILANRNITLPLLTGNDVLVTADFIQTLTNKTINATNNTITDASTAVGDLLVSNGTKFVRFAMGSALQYLRVNSGGAFVEWATITGVTASSGVDNRIAVFTSTTNIEGDTDFTWDGVNDYFYVNGKVGIRMATPSADLDIKGTTTSGSNLILRDSGDDIVYELNKQDILGIYDHGIYLNSVSYPAGADYGYFYYNDPGNRCGIRFRKGDSNSEYLQYHNQFIFKIQDVTYLTLTSASLTINGTVIATGGNSTQWNTAYTHSQIAGGDSVHVSTTENTQWDAAYTHSIDNSQAHSDYLINNGNDVTSGTLTAVNFILSSDRKLKRDISPFYGEGLDMVVKLQPVYFRWKKDDNNTLHLGFIANDVEQVCSCLVSEGDNQLKGISYSGITAIHNAAISELYLEIKKLQKEIGDLKNGKST